MYIQVIDMQIPIGQFKELRELVETEYLPAIRHRPGFVRADLLEQVDDPDTAKLIVYWDDQASVENTQKTGILAGSTQSIAARLPGLRLQKQSYIVKVTVTNEKSVATQTV